MRRHPPQRKHPDRVIAAIEALTLAGVNAGEIRRRLEAGQVEGLEPYKMPLRTVQEHAARTRRNHEPLPEDEIDAVNAIERLVLAVCTRDAKRLERKNRKELLSKGEYEVLLLALKNGQAIRDARRKREANPDRKKGGRKRAEKQRAKPETLLDIIARDQKRAEAEADGAAQSS